MSRVVAIAVSLLVLLPGVAAARHTGVVFGDVNASGALDPGEPAIAGITVTNGRDVVVTGADGRYDLPQRVGGFVSITCPAKGRCPAWFRRGGGDFGIVPEAASDDFFFVQISDLHAYPKVEDLASLMPDGGLPWWLPRNLVGWFLLRVLGRMYPTRTDDEIVGHLRDVVARHREVDGKWDTTIVMDYLDLVVDPETGLAKPGLEIPRALAEVKSLAPELVISTGDMILEGNSGDADYVEAWYDYYQRVVGEAGLDVYETIGNNELGGTDNDDFLPSDPRYGKALFRRFFGPTHYSFDRGPFHFVALDTHRREFEEGEDEEWSFNDMEPSVRDWLDADLEAARGRVLVVLNHEPFHIDPAWEMDDDFEHANDEGLFEKHGVAYALAGHIHRNGFQDAPPGGGTTHITTGALSGFRWALPMTIDRHGYRLFYASEGRLYSAWKDVGQPLLGFVDPVGDPAIFPASAQPTDPRAISADFSVVAVAADVDRQFAKVELSLDGEPVAASRWGDYFLHARVRAEDVGPAGASLLLRAVGSDGRSHESRLSLTRSAADGA